ncbi:MAG: hypothetical protein ACRERU_15145, partial [Methylococcales bacterium]
MIWLVVVFIALWILAYHHVNGWVAWLLIAAVLTVCSAAGEQAVWSASAWIVFISLVIVFKVPWVRCRLISAPLLKVMRKSMPSV